MPAVEQNSVQSVDISDYETYLRQRSLNSALTTSAVVSGVWFAFGVIVLGVAIVMRPAADVVGMDPAGREHPITVIKMPIPAQGAKR